MSWDMSIRFPKCGTCGTEPESVSGPNVTRNASKIVEACLIAAGAPVSRAPASEDHCRDFTWGRLHHWPASEAIPILQRALAEACSPGRCDEFKKMEPANGWGSLEGVREAFAELLNICLQNPTGFIHCWG